MAYITNSEIEDRLGSGLYIQLTDDSGSGSADLDVVNAARLEAEGLVDSFLARRYSVPIDLVLHSPVASLVKGVVLDLVEYRLHTRRPPVTSDVITKHSYAVEWLNQVGRGEVELPSVATVAANSATGPNAAITGAARLLTRDELADY